MKRVIAIILCAVMVLSFAACGKSASQETAQPTLPTNYESLENTQVGTEAVDFANTEVAYQKEIIIGTDAALQTLDPFENPGTPTADYTMMAYDRLVNYDELEMTFSPELAKDWTWVDDTTLELNLRDDVVFSDGSKFTAEDVVFSFERCASFATGGAKLNVMESVEAVDDYKVRFNLVSPNMDFLNTISYYFMCIVSKNAYETDPENAAKVTTGAWLVDEFVPSDHYTLVRNENYWGEIPVTEKITVKYIPEASARLIALQNGEIDICLRVSEEEAAYAEEDPNVQLTIIPANTCIYFAFNSSEGPGSDKNFRLALAHCLNKEDIIAAAANGYGAPAVTNWGRITYGHDESFGDYGQDFEKAKEYLAQSEFDTIDVIVRGNKTRDVNALVTIQEQARQAGITVNVNEVENATLSEMTHYDSATHQAVVYSYGWSTFGDDARSPYFKDSNVNKAHIDNQEIMDLIDAAAGEQDEAARMEMYAKVQAINHEEAYYLPLFYSVIFQAIKNNVQGVVWGSGINDFTYACLPVEG